jgi:hypothetical protein
MIYPYRWDNQLWKGVPITPTEGAVPLEKIAPISHPDRCEIGMREPDDMPSPRGLSVEIDDDV